MHGFKAFQSMCTHLYFIEIKVAVEIVKKQEGVNMLQAELFIRDVAFDYESV